MLIFTPAAIRPRVQTGPRRNVPPNVLRAQLLYVSGHCRVTAASTFSMHLRRAECNRRYARDRRGRFTLADHTFPDWSSVRSLRQKRLIRVLRASPLQVDLVRAFHIEVSKSRGRRGEGRLALR